MSGDEEHIEQTLRSSVGSAAFSLMDRIDEDATAAILEFVPHLVTFVRALADWPELSRMQFLVGMAMEAATDEQVNR